MFKLLFLSTFWSVVIASEFWVPGEKEYTGVDQGASSADYGYPAYSREEPRDLGAYEQETRINYWEPADFENPEVQKKEVRSFEELDNMEVPGDHGYQEVHSGREHARTFLNEWTVEVDGTEEVAQLVALELGYVYGGPVSIFHLFK